MKNLHHSYNSVAAGEDTFAYGLLDAVMNRGKTLFCYAESVDRYESVSILIDEKDGERVRIKSNNEKLESNSFTEFLDGGRYICPLYIMERVND